MFAPVAVKEVEVPEQIVKLGVNVIVGVVLTLRVVTAVFVQELDVPITVYVISVLGFAFTTLAVLELSDALGDQLYVLAPIAVKEAEVPEQIVKLGVNVIVGVVLTLRVVTAVFVQEFDVPITV